ncbi:MAG: hypothetical protein AB7D96_10610 [Arcobacteraceae bacterium]
MKKEIKVVFKKESMAALKQEWMIAKEEGIECEVNTEIHGTRLEIIINGESYVADMAEIANSLIKKVVS